MDVHHIISWERCREHAYDNLIALCPNCHRRADAGEIDRKALRMYKARLTSSSISFDAPPPDVAERQDTRWRVVRVTDTRSETPAYEVEIEIPAFAVGDLEELNRIEHGWALGCIQSFRHILLSPAESFLPMNDAGWVPPAGYLSGTFAVTHFDETAISLRYAMSEYRYGAAHGNSWFRTVTALRDPFVLLRFADLFVPSSGYLQRISSLAVEELLRSHDHLDADWVRRGAGPDLENFTIFNLTDIGLVVTFPPYQVASWADGPQEVTIPWRMVGDVLNPRVGL